MKQDYYRTKSLELESTLRSVLSILMKLRNKSPNINSIEREYLIARIEGALNNGR